MRPNTCIKIALCVMVMISTTVHSVGNDRAKFRDKPVDTIVLHTIGGPYCKKDKLLFSGSPGNAYRWKKFFESQKGLSIHYIVDRSGNITASIDEAKVAWHAKGHNASSIGIELINNGDGIEIFPKVQLLALTQLVKSIKARHPNISNKRIVRHSDIDSRTFKCAGVVEKLKQDPGVRFPYNTFINGL